MSAELLHEREPAQSWPRERKPRRESSLERYFVTRVREIGAMVVKIQCLRGWPDRMVLWPGAEVDFVELKAPGEKPSDLQTWIHEKLKQFGFDVYCFSDRLEIERYLSRRKTW